MDAFCSPRRRHFSEELQKLNDLMLEVQRLRRCVALAEIELRKHTDVKKARLATRRGFRLVVDASVGETAIST
jgi:hypothetical protein